MSEPDVSEVPEPLPPMAPLPGTPGHKSDLPTRFAVAIVLIAVACVAVFVGGWLFRGLVLVGAAIMLAEWAEMHKVSWLWTWVGVALLALLLLGGMQYLFPVGEADAVQLGDGEQMLAIDWVTFKPLLYLLGAAVGGGVLLAIASRRLTMGWGFLYIAVPSLALLALSWADFTLVFWVMIVTWSTDIGAYFAGRRIGGPKLAPRISPSKTWAGLGGGVVMAGLLGWLAARYFRMDEVPLFDQDAGEQTISTAYAAFLYIGGAMAVVAQGGDLYESWVKRRCGVKDSGTLLPGHGGVLDRCDGLMAVSVATLAFFIVGLWTW